MIDPGHVRVREAGGGIAKGGSFRRERGEAFLTPAYPPCSKRALSGKGMFKSNILGADMTQEPGGPDRSFAERLKAARHRQGMDPDPKPTGEQPDVLGKSPLGVGLRVGLELVSAFVVAVAIGYGLDWVFDTKPLLTVAFIPLGGAAGIANIYRMFAPKPDKGPKTGVS